MELRFAVELPVPFPQAERALLRAPGDWVPGVARAAEAGGARILSEVGIGRAPGRVSKQVEVQLAHPFRFESKTVLPMRWDPTGAAGLLPGLEAMLELERADAGHARLSIRADYEPPLGAVGRVIDRAMLHRVAEATVKDFIERAGEALQGLATQEP
jgi:hypothetical protein